MGRNPSIQLEVSELKEMFADPVWISKFPPLLSVDAAADLANVPKGTIYDWSSRGLLASCANKRGKRLLILRDRFVQFLFGSEG
jgi:hypothetical protein